MLGLALSPSPPSSSPFPPSHSALLSERKLIYYNFAKACQWNGDYWRTIRKTTPCVTSRRRVGNVQGVRIHVLVREKKIILS